MHYLLSKKINSATEDIYFHKDEIIFNGYMMIDVCEKNISSKDEYFFKSKYFSLKNYSLYTEEKKQFILNVCDNVKCKTFYSIFSQFNPNRFQCVK